MNEVVEQDSSPLLGGDQGPAYNNFGGLIFIAKDVADVAIKAKDVIANSVRSVLPKANPVQIVTSPDVLGKFPGVKAVQTTNGQVTEVMRIGGQHWQDVATYRKFQEWDIQDAVNIKRMTGHFPETFQPELIPEAERRLAQEAADAAGGSKITYIPPDATTIGPGNNKAPSIADDASQAVDDASTVITERRVATEGLSTVLESGSKVDSRAGAIIVETAGDSRAASKIANAAGATKGVGKFLPYVEVSIGLIFIEDNYEFGERQGGSVLGCTYAVAQCIPVANDVSDIGMAVYIAATTDWDEVSLYEFSEAMRTEFVPSQLANWAMGIEEVRQVDVPRQDAAFWSMDQGKVDFAIMQHLDREGFGRKAVEFWRASGNDAPDWEDFSWDNDVLLPDWYDEWVQRRDNG